ICQPGRSEAAAARQIPERVPEGPAITVAATLVRVPECGLAVDYETEEHGKAGEYAQPDPERRYARPLWRFLVFLFQPTPISSGCPNGQGSRQENQSRDREIPQDVAQISFQDESPNLAHLEVRALCAAPTGNDVDPVRVAKVSCSPKRNVARDRRAISQAAEEGRDQQQNERQRQHQADRYRDDIDHAVPDISNRHFLSPLRESFLCHC
ncbi:MAG: hypothetical protein V3R22_01450, partial [Kiloniellales bacterium]